MLKKILCTYDGSRESEEAYELAKYFAGLYKSDVHGLYVNQVYFPITPNFVYYAGYIEEAAHKKKKQIESRFNKIKKELARSKIKFTGKVIKGDIDEAVRNYSSLINADLIVAGNTGKDFVERLILGSNTLKILRNSNVPVLTVPPLKKGSAYKVKKILVPLDISERNYDSLDYAIDIASRTGSHITILYILTLPPTGDMPAKVIDEIVAGSNIELQDLVLKSKLNNKDLGISKKLIMGLNPAMRILDYAKRNSFNLLVLNSHNKGNLQRFFLGSVAEELIRGSDCPVFTVRPKG